MQIALIAFFAIALLLLSPRLVDRLANRHGRRTKALPSTRARELHEQLWIADLHADSLLWDRNLLRRSRRGHTDIPRLVSGNVAFQVFTVVSKVPLGINFEKNSDSSDLILPLAVLQRWPPRTWLSLKERALYQARKLRRLAEASGGALTVIRSMGDLEKCSRQRETDRATVAGLLGIEGAQVLEGELSNVDVMFDAGFRLMGPVHFFDTEVAGSAHGIGKGGLTPLGRQVIARAQELGMIIDLAHASRAAIEDVLDFAEKPVLVSHTGVRGTCDSTRNLDDASLLGVARAGGLIGIAFFTYAVCGKTTDAIIRAIRYAVERVGVEHVALGSDFDGAVRTPFDCASLVELTDSLLRADFSDQEVAAIMGGNVRRFLPKVLPLV
jgi:microsomal dipeptidase-like Zn-dependent dipeptidase